jgi:hypothetical protein
MARHVAGRDHRVHIIHDRLFGFENLHARYLLSLINENQPIIPSPFILGEWMNSLYVCPVNDDCIQVYMSLTLVQVPWDLV